MKLICTWTPSQDNVIYWIVCYFAIFFHCNIILHVVVTVFGNNSFIPINNLNYNSLYFVTSGTSIMRLSDGAHPLEGRVEVNINGVWSTVCDENWDDVDAQVVCEMMVGYPRDL